LYTHSYTAPSESSVQDYMQVATKFIFSCSPKESYKWPWLCIVNDTVQMALCNQAVQLLYDSRVLNGCSHEEMDFLK
jgi:hypothetical protein